MNQDEYNAYYLSFKQTGQFSAILLQEYLNEKGEKFNLNQFLQVLAILANPFQAMQYNLAQYQGINFQEIMINTVVKHYDDKFGIQRYDINFSQIKDVKYLKLLSQKYPNGIINI